MGTELHPLLRALSEVDPRRIKSRELPSIFAAAQSGGATPSEKRVLHSMVRQHGEGWSRTVHQEWTTRLGQLKAGPASELRRKSSAAPEDVSARIGTLWMHTAAEYLQNVYVADLVRLGKRHGFAITLQAERAIPKRAVLESLAQHTGLPASDVAELVRVVHTGNGELGPWSEDNKIVTSSSRRRVILFPEVSDDVLGMAARYTKADGYHPHSPDFQGRVPERDREAAELLPRKLGLTRVFAKSYLEGGNVLTGTTADGEPYALIGKDSLVISAFALYTRGELSLRAVSAALERLERKGLLSDEALREIGVRLVAVETQEQPRATELTGAQLESARAFAGILEATKGVIAEDLSIPRERVVYLTQLGFHVDMHLRPLAQGEVLVDHPRTRLELLDRLLSKKGLPRWQERELTEMRRRSEADLKERGHIHDSVTRELSAAGLIVIRTPGVFDSGVRSANFMNGVPGTNGSGESFYISNASSIAPLQDAFATFVRRLGVSHVDFVGAEGGSATRLSIAEQSLRNGGGLDCREVHHD